MKLYESLEKQLKKATYYYVKVSSWSTYSHYKVDKFTSKISESAHKHYARDNEEREKFEIIK
ncbi:MAG: hypothetical protein EXR24_04320 [Ignavibacteria bacterium]|nr:hypothetical protein [Ignavibacteria bacterium]